MVATILRALREELLDRRVLHAFDASDHCGEPDELQCWPELYMNINDNITGVKLDPELVAAGRREEMELLKEIDAYSYEWIANCKKTTGRGPVPTRWVDINKGDKATPFVRCRWVIQETKNHTTMDITDPALTFSAAPPYEALRFLVSLWMTPSGKKQQGCQLLFIDITRAHPHSLLTR